MSKELKIKIEKGQNANYQIAIEIDAQNQESMKESTYTNIQKTYKKDGFRTWHVPLDIIKKEVNAAYLEVEILENTINRSLQQVLDTYKDIKWIWQPYNLDKKQEWDKTIVTYNLDTYPEAIEKNSNYKTIKLDKVDGKITADDIKAAITNLAKEYATYEPSDSINHDTTDRLIVKYLDKDGQILHTKTIFTEHQDKHDPFFKALDGKKQWDIVTVDYKNIPEKLDYTQDNNKPSNIEITVNNIVIEKLAEIDDARVKEKFGGEGINDLKTLEKKISEQMEEYKYQQELTKVVDEYITKAKDSFDISIPDTIIESEYKNRYDNYVKRFGSKENFEKTVLANPEWQQMMDKLQDEIKVASKTSLEKFFIFQKLVELLDVKDVKRDQELDAEQKLYDHLSK